MVTITGGTAKKTRSTKATGAAMPAELGEFRKEFPGISDADLAYIRGGVIYKDLMVK